MSAVRRSDNNNIEVGRVIPELRSRVKDCGAWMRSPCLRLSFGITCDNRGKIQSRRRLDQWSVKDRAGESVTDESDAKGAARFCACESQYRSVLG